MTCGLDMATYASRKHPALVGLGSSMGKRITGSSIKETHKQGGDPTLAMAAISTARPPSLLPSFLPLHSSRFQKNVATCSARSRARARAFRVRAAKLPAGVEVPRVQPRLSEPFLGFTTTAEVWNSRACMLGLIGVFIVELVLHKGVLQTIGVEVGKGLNLPL